MKQKNKKEIIRWGIIGCGNVTELKSGPAYSKTEGFALHAVMRRDSSKAEDYSRRHNVPKFYSDADELINDPEVDAIYIATPPDTHKFYALKVASAGKPCCIEKPMAPNYEDCKIICDAFEEKGLPLFVAYYRRSLPRFLKVKTWLDDGEIGQIRNVEWHFCKPASTIDVARSDNWRTDATIAPGGYFDDLASHGIDLLAFLLGDITQATGFSVNQQGLYSAKDAVVAAWLHDGNVTGSASWNFGANQRQDVVRITGSGGIITFSVFDEVAIRLQNDTGITELFIDNPENIQLYHVGNMRRQLTGGEAHPSNGASAMKTAWVMDRILGKDLV